MKKIIFYQLMTLKMKMNWTNENLDIYRKIRHIVKRGSYVRSEELTALFNSVFNKNRRNTNCSSCLKILFQELQNSYRQFLKENNIEDEIEWLK